MKILAIDTSCDETSAAVTDGRRVLSNVIYSQVLIHKKWGGVVPSLAKRAHEERIDLVINETLKKLLGPVSPTLLTMKGIDAIAVTYGPGLAVALEVGIKKTKELALKYNKKIIAINHMEGHIYSAFTQNSKGNPKQDFKFPYLVLLVSGGHTELVLFEDHLKYKVIGQTIDDAAGEALDKAAKMLGLGYPGGPIIEKLAQDEDNNDFFKFPRPMLKSLDLNFSFSGLKTAFYYFIKKMSEVEKNKQLKKLASSFQEAVFDTLIKKTERGIKLTGVNRLIVSGGVSANLYLRKKFRGLCRSNGGSILFPPYNYLTGDNAAMIGVVAHYHAERNDFVKDFSKLDRVPRLTLT